MFKEAHVSGEMQRDSGSGVWWWFTKIWGARVQRATLGREGKDAASNGRRLYSHLSLFRAALAASLQTFGTCKLTAVAELAGASSVGQLTGCLLLAHELLATTGECKTIATQRCSLSASQSLPVKMARMELPRILRPGEGIASRVWKCDPASAARALVDSRVHFCTSQIAL